jgi:hypothetical protein
VLRVEGGQSPIDFDRLLMKVEHRNSIAMNESFGAARAFSGNPFYSTPGVCNHGQKVRGAGWLLIGG